MNPNPNGNYRIQPRDPTKHELESTVSSFCVQNREEEKGEGREESLIIKRNILCDFGDVKIKCA